MVINKPKLIAPCCPWERVRIGGISGGQVHAKAKKMVEDTQKELNTWKVDGKKKQSFFKEQEDKRKLKVDPSPQKPKEKDESHVGK